MSYDYTDIPIISVFGVSEAEIHDVSYSLTSVSALQVCGGGRENPHPAYTFVVRPFAYESSLDDNDAALAWTIRNGYHEVPFYATGNYANDFARIDTNAPGGCNNGEFRDQAIMRAENGEFIFRTQHDEPNPEVFGYIWPSFWWGLYTAWWHVTDGGTV